MKSTETHRLASEYSSSSWQSHERGNRGSANPTGNMTGTHSLSVGSHLLATARGGERRVAAPKAKSIMNMPPSLSGKVLKKKWKLGALVGKGGCAEVYEAIDTRAASESAGAGPFVAKVAPLAVGLPPAMSKGKKRKKTEQEKHADMIYYEYTLYKGFLLQHEGVVEVGRRPARRSWASLEHDTKPPEVPSRMPTSYE